MAGALHSIYATDHYRRQLISYDRRQEIAELAGEAAERLAYLFCAISRDGFWRAVRGRAADTDRELCVPRHGGLPSGYEILVRSEIPALMTLYMANAAEQLRGPIDDAPSGLAAINRMAMQLHLWSDRVPAIFGSCTAKLSIEDDARSAAHYRAGLGLLWRDAAAARQQFAAAMSACPYVAEPQIGIGCAALIDGDVGEARVWLRRGRRILGEWGTSWDKRETYEGWLHRLSAMDTAAHDERRLQPTVFSMGCEGEGRLVSWLS